jgi:hypothetical protein
MNWNESLQSTVWISPTPSWPLDFEPDLLSHPLVRRVDAAPPATEQWPWFPRWLPALGLGIAPPLPIWYWGVPRGQERHAFYDAVLALSRHRRQLPPAILAEARSWQKPIAVSVLTVPS